jgi:hypothetical protein
MNDDVIPTHRTPFTVLPLNANSDAVNPSNDLPEIDSVDKRFDSHRELDRSTADLQRTRWEGEPSPGDGQDCVTEHLSDLAHSWIGGDFMFATSRVDPPVDEHDEIVSQPQRFVAAVRHEQRRRTEHLEDTREFVEQMCVCACVESLERFIEKNERCVKTQRTRKAGPSSFAA